MSERGLEGFRDLGLLVLRVGVGVGFIWYHGWPKIVGGPERWAGVGGAMENVGITFAPAFWGLLAGLAESLGALFVILGLFFRPTAFVLAMVMFMAMLNHHVTGQGTPAHAFKNMWLFLGLVAIGPGRFSVDHLIARRKAGDAGAASVDEPAMAHGGGEPRETRPSEA